VLAPVASTTITAVASASFAPFTITGAPVSTIAIILALLAVLFRFFAQGVVKMLFSPLLHGGLSTHLDASLVIDTDALGVDDIPDIDNILNPVDPEIAEL
jgi:hypothetical protein